MRNQPGRHPRRQRRTARRPFSSSSRACRPPPSWRAAFAVAALVLGAPPGSAHRAGAARAEPFPAGAAAPPSLRGEIPRRRTNGRKDKDNNHKSKGKHRSKGNAKWGNNHVSLFGMENSAHTDDDDDNVALSNESIEDVVTAVAELEALDALDHGDTAGLEQGLEDMAEDLIADTFPPGCSWSCYRENYPDLTALVHNTEAAALKHWIEHGQNESRDCTCKDQTELGAAPQTKSAAEEEEEVVENIESIAEKLEELESEDDDAAEVEKLVLAEVEEELIEATFPPGCTWECYLDKHPWLADHIARTEGAAYEHFARHGLDPWDCSCTQEGPFVRPASGLRMQVWFSATVLLLACWAVHQYRSLRRGGAHERLATVDGEEKPTPVKYRDTVGVEDSPSVEYHDTTDTASCAQIALST